MLQKQCAVRGRANRGVEPSEASWELKASFTLEKVAALEPGERIDKWCELVAGYPAALSVDRQAADDTLGVFLRIDMRRSPTHLQGALSAGVALKVDWTLTLNVKRSHSRYFSVATFPAWGYPNFFEKPWAESVREGSPHFPNGKLEVKATFKLAVKE